jgi:hypothetical protein
MTNGSVAFFLAMAHRPQSPVNLSIEYRQLGFNHFF